MIKSKSRFLKLKPTHSTRSEMITTSNTSTYDDYMSDHLLHVIISTENPSTISKSDHKRKFDDDEDKLDKNISIKQKMEETLIEGTTKVISSTNKGFQLLQKFGYKGEGGLGKDNHGRSDPINININMKLDTKDRSGIGVAEEKKRKIEKFEKDMMKISQLRNAMLSDFKSRLIFENEMKRIVKDIRSAEKVIYELDMKYHLEFNCLWPRNIVDREKEQDQKDDKDDDYYEDEDEIETVEDDFNELMKRLQDCLYYLRDNYSYCLFCGCQYEDSDDLIRNCPGLLEQDH